ncbi:MAG: Y-family DNA polymerase [Candidatus Dojkabacteria bacterium]|nr:Y-family DNA polymerase [Candidatus Dojkabacteria bacterium]MDQ7020834.1 Y-family DNA polymerase [Candidatus Dojkabacteria bacterium]
MYALVDCNNFFVSCERVFNPKLWNKPTIVLSNNDGCVVARSQEVKDMGVAMGVPYFKIKDLLESKNVNIFSSNFILYGDLSNRVMKTLMSFVDDIELYSIDEAFLRLDDDIDKYTSLGDSIVDTVKKNIGLPVSVGIARTKTLAKIANEIGKLQRRFNSTTDLSILGEAELDDLLNKLDISEVWGIGYRTSEKLRGDGIYNVKDFKYSDRAFIRKKYSVTVERTYLEINGVSCFKLDNNPTPRKGISYTRSFGTPITKIEELEQAVASYTSNALRKLRKQKSVANFITVYIRTGKYGEDKPYSNATTMTLDNYSNYSPDFIKKGLEALKLIYKNGYRYKKSGIYITGIRDENSIQYSMLHSYNKSSEDQKSTLMQNIDFINSKFGTELVRSGKEINKERWRVRSDRISSRYTTSWDELLNIKI